MAASMESRFLLKRLAKCINSYHAARNVSNFFNSPKNLQHVVTSTKSGKTIVCWHPEIPIPYEQTQPLPRSHEQLSYGDSPLKIQHLEAVDSKPPSIQQLNEMFHVTKHVWKYEPKRRNAKENPPKDRNAL